MSAPDLGLRATVIGCGNTLRGDDGAGIVAVRLLRGQLDAAALGSSGLELFEAGCPGLGILDLLRDFHVALIVDTVVGGTAPGTIHHCDGDELARNQRLRFGSFSSHDAGLASALAIGQTLFPDQMPPSLAIWGIEPESVRFGEGLSPPVAAALPALVSCLRTICRLGSSYWSPASATRHCGSPALARWSKMHEHRLAQEILRVALAAPPDGAGRVRVIDLVVGDLTVANESIRFHFDLLSQGTLAEGAILRFSPQASRCPHCNAELSGEMHALAICPSCAQSRPNADGTGLCYVQGIEID